MKLKHLFYIISIVITLPSILLVPIILINGNLASQLLNKSELLESILARNSFFMFSIDFFILLNIIILYKSNNRISFGRLKPLFIAYTILGLMRIFGDLVSNIIIQGFNNLKK